MYKLPKGTYDVLPAEIKKWQRIENFLHRIMSLYNYDEIRTPIFEESAVFHRNADDSSDVVNKETYDFIDRGKRSMTLRPEGTAGVIRSFIENKMYAQNSLTRLYYIGPQFRYENPQKGRFRQFSQFGFEAIGSDSPELDAEVISLTYNIITRLQIPNTKVKINSLGDKASRDNYREVLVSYFKGFITHLCSDCLKRLEKNPLRLLDCKSCRKENFFSNVPLINDYLSVEAKKRFQIVLENLDAIGIKYEIDNFLVRGLDYYAHTVFEIETEEALGSQNVLGGGGHYDRLVSDLKGPALKGIGVAFGMERLLLVMDYYKLIELPEAFVHFYLLPLGDEAKRKASELLNSLRMGGLICETDYNNRSFKANLNNADKLNSRFIGILGSDELNNNEITIKNQKTKTQEKVSLDVLYNYLKQAFSQQHSCNSCRKDKQ